MPIFLAFPNIAPAQQAAPIAPTPTPGSLDVARSFTKQGLNIDGDDVDDTLTVAPGDVVDGLITKFTDGDGDEWDRTGTGKYSGPDGKTFQHYSDGSYNITAPDPDNPSGPDIQIEGGSVWAN